VVVRGHDGSRLSERATRYVDCIAYKQQNNTTCRIEQLHQTIDVSSYVWGTGACAPLNFQRYFFQFTSRPQIVYNVDRDQRVTTTANRQSTRVARMPRMI